MKSSLAVIAAIAIIGVATAGVLAIITDSETSSGSAKRGEPRTNDGLTVCVLAVGLPSEVQARASLAVASALDVLTAHPVWQDTPYDRSAPEVLEGCPTGPAVYDCTWTRPQPCVLFDVLGRKVETPSYFGLHVYVLSQEEIERINSSSHWRQTSEEVMCSGDACGEVTTGLYIGENEIGDHDFLVTQLDAALGLSVSLAQE